MSLTYTLISPASPLAGDETSTAYMKWLSANDRNAGPISLWGDGEWEGDNLLIETCGDLAASPQVWSPEVTKTANFAYHFNPAEGTGIRVRTTNSGSPAHSLTVKIKGDLVLA